MELPLLAPARDDRVLTWRDGAAVRGDRFVADVLALAERLPDRAQVINCCADRYLFTVALAASMMRRQVTHLPNDRTRHTLSHLADRHADIYCQVDADTAPAGIASVRVDVPTPEPPAGGEMPAFPADQIVAYVYTGGTTGEPSANTKTWGALVDGAGRIADAIGVRNHAGAAVVATVPAQHMYGLEFSVMLPLTEDIAVHAGRPFYPSDVTMAARETQRDVVLVTTPVHLKALVAARTALPSLVGIISATSPLSRSLAEKAERTLGASVMEIFGCTEAGTLAWRHPLASPIWRTLAGITLAERDGGWWANVPYLPEPVALQDVLEPRSATEFELKGRTSEMVNVAGKRASLSGLNAILNDIPGVHDGVYYADDELADDDTSRLTAIVVAPGLSEADIRSRLREMVDDAFQPRPLYLVDALPRSATGKLTKSALAELVCRAQNVRK